MSIPKLCYIGNRRKRTKRLKRIIKKWKNSILRKNDHVDPRLQENREDRFQIQRSLLEADQGSVGSTHPYRTTASVLRLVSL